MLGTGLSGDLEAARPDGFDHTRPMLLERVTETGRFVFASVLAVDVGGGRSATLVVIEDVSRSAEARRFTDLAWLLGVGLLGLLPLVLLWFYLRRAFEPLEEAVEALRRLAAGRTDHYAELTSGDDEIGDISRAIEVFRQNALELERNADLEERRRRRQARFIHRQMTTLSETLDEEAQAAALEDLRQIEAASSGDAQAIGEDDTRFSDQLGLIGVALERMTARVRSQQQVLSELIDELREALEMKTRLISLEQELDIARQMQQNVLPRRFPATPGFEIAVMMQPAREVGGDFYDIFQVDQHRVGVAVADVSGKGIPAAFFMLIARTLLKAIAIEGAGPGKTLARLNEFLCGDNEETMFATLFYGQLDSRSGRFVYANGGHNNPHLATPGGPVTALPSTDGMALAVFDQQTFAERTVTLETGQTLLLYTDGVTEAFDPEGTMFGDDRLAGLLESPTTDTENGTARALLDTILYRVERFCGGAPQSDDITLIVIAGRPAAAALPFRAADQESGVETAAGDNRSAAWRAPPRRAMPNLPGRPGRACAGSPRWRSCGAATRWRPEPSSMRWKRPGDGRFRAPSGRAGRRCSTSSGSRPAAAPISIGRSRSASPAPARVALPRWRRQPSSPRPVAGTGSRGRSPLPPWRGPRPVWTVPQPAIRDTSWTSRGWPSSRATSPTPKRPSMPSPGTWRPGRWSAVLPCAP